MTIRNITNTITTGMLLLFATCTQAASVSYILDQSNRFEDGVDYLSVTLSDDAGEGMLSVTVNILPALQSLLVGNAGIEAFSFNVGDGVQAGGHGRSGLWGGYMHGKWCGHIDHMGGGHRFENDDEGYGDHKGEGHKGKGGHNGHNGHNGDMLTRRDFELPDGWHTRFNRGRGQSSMYDVTVLGRDPQDPLQFFIEGLSIEDILDEFAVRVTGLSADCGAASHHGKCFARDTRAYFYGDGPPTVIPLPASIWLLGSGMLGLVGIARRKRS